jgi:hypothetical protein
VTKEASNEYRIISLMRLICFESPLRDTIKSEHPKSPVKYENIFADSIIKYLITPSARKQRHLKSSRDLDKLLEKTMKFEE